MKKAFTLSCKTFRSDLSQAELSQTPVSSSQTKYRSAAAHSYGFTLAEVMTVLTILGVVATLTLSTVFHNIQKSQIETRFKIIYSTLSNSIDIAEAENGPTSTWAYHRNDIKTNIYSRDPNNASNLEAKLAPEQAQAFAERYLIPYLNVMYVCDRAGNHKCFAGSEDNWYTGNGYNDDIESYGRRRAYAFRLKNGMSIAVNMVDNMPNNMAVAKITVDIDGPEKGKSISGRDVFFFSVGALDNHGNRMRFAPGLFDWGGTSAMFKNPTGWWNWVNPRNSCEGSKTTSKSPGNAIAGNWAGAGCSVQIYRNNFKLSYNPNIFPNEHKD